MRPRPPPFEVWVCHGRMCTARGADALASRARDCAALSEGQCRVLRGGCYGLCELGPNVVVREPGGPSPAEDVADRLSLTHADGETVYCGVTSPDVDRIVQAHRTGEAPIVELTRATREAEQPARGTVEARLRALRKRRRGNTPK